MFPVGREGQRQTWLYGLVPRLLAMGTVCWASLTLGQESRKGHQDWRHRGVNTAGPGSRPCGDTMKPKLASVMFFLETSISHLQAIWT